MTMLKLISISTLLGTLLCIISAEENVTIVKEIKLHKPFITSIVDGSHLLMISSNTTHVFVNSSDELAKACILVVDRVEHPIQKRVKATMLGDKIIIWGVRTLYYVDETTRMDYTVIIVDPKQCSYKPVKTYEEEFPSFNVDMNLPDVVTHDESFDVFYSTVRGCTPCRYSIDGKRLDLNQSIEPEALEVVGHLALPVGISSHVKAFDGPELKTGYFYAHNYNNQTSVIRLYDRDFNVVKEKTLDHKIDAVEVSHEDHPTITICYTTSTRYMLLNDEAVNCERFDANFEYIFSTDLLLLKKHDPASVSLAVDSSGNSFIAVVESNGAVSSIESEKIDVFRLHKLLNTTGQVTNIIKLGEMPRTRYWTDWRLRGFIFNKQYCFEITKLWPVLAHPSDADKNESVKCIAI